MKDLTGTTSPGQYIFIKPSTYVQLRTAKKRHSINLWVEEGLHEAPEVIAYSGQVELIYGNHHIHNGAPPMSLWLLSPLEWCIGYSNKQNYETKCCRGWNKMIIKFLPSHPGSHRLCRRSQNLVHMCHMSDSRLYHLGMLDETDCISHSTNTLGKCMNPIILPPAMGK